MDSNDGFGDKRLRSQLSWWVFGLVLAIILVYTLRGYLGWIVFGVFLYYVARPVARQLRQRWFSESTAAIITLGLVILPFVGILIILASIAIVQLATLDATDFELIVETLFPDGIPDTVPTAEEEVYPFVEDLATDPSFGSVIEWGGDVLSAFVAAAYNMFITLIFVFFLVRDEQRLAEWFRLEMIGERTRVDEFAQAIDKGLSSIFFGYTLTILAIMVLAAILYTLLNAIAPAGLAIPQVLLLAIITGLASVIPLIGRNIVYAAIVVYLAVLAIQTDLVALWFPVVFYVVMGVLFDGVIRTYIRPSLSGRMFPTGLILFAYILGPVAFGWYGIFLGPLLMVAATLFVQMELPRLLHGEPK
ncbi:AI-2E family transporter [Natronorubrum sulfidifaciens]|uniref:Permease n=1 Tax=Natronorubrum sulfidifaciens JCM 14089 TaxID=1230460 RepID=L9VX89_9EURY|nr:AI-2E family transporter [Natronorubrum sulfidifaciens]ELY41627.1 permease [Natronorubrum sulfidifaciens JCM 14089]